MSRKRSSSHNFYYKIKKERYMKSVASDSDSEDSDGANDRIVTNSICTNHSATNDESRILFDKVDSNETNSSSGSFHIESNDQLQDEISEPNEVQVQKPADENLHSKLIKWVINNIDKLPLTSVDELLQVLISEGYKTFPPTAHALLGYKHCINSQRVLTKNGTFGQYLYLGILNGLENRIDPGAFNEDSIKIVVFIDGMKIYKNSKGQLWPIAVQLYDKKYICPPFIAGLFYGDAKPSDVGSLLNDFVDEVKLLVTNGVTIQGTSYSFKLVALIADGQARAYLKCIKGPIAFYGCERCTIRGVTIQKKRVYPETNFEKRSKDSFDNKTQPEHHQEDVTTPLIKIPGFDPVKDVILDSMHLLFLGAMKYLLVKWVEKGSSVRLSRQNRQTFKRVMDSVSEYVPKEFQRKVFDTDDVSHWKATQYRFMLLYAGPIILKFVLNTNVYKHFLLLHVACRILCSAELVVENVDYADNLLKKFFKLMPKFYGEACQVMNFHNLIHVADDVRHLQAPLSDFSSFWGENFIGKLKYFVQSAAKPLQQIINRLNAVETLGNIKIKKKCILEEYNINENADVIRDDEGRMIPVNSVKIYDMFISSSPPNNTVQLKNNKIFIISDILLRENDSTVKDLNDFYIEGFEGVGVEEIFVNPCKSSDLGSVKINEFSEKMKRFSLKKMKSKCLLLKVNNDNYAITFLHSICTENYE
ncbi:uncharacterized protein LOC130677522 [Microplitis mediator]|uniref:uncharacterized protein LOC130677522 n=1 Tax=Microplitis mediator TaxID=375433 RepID=UPI0025571D9B|nr:uncharacterized protein LOC130677522 [Microplitis mediator]